MIRFKHHRPFYDYPYLVAIQHNLRLGDGPLVIRVLSGHLPMGLSTDTHYYAIPLNGDYFRLATSRLNACDNHPVHMTTSGDRDGYFLIGPANTQEQQP